MKYYWGLCSSLSNKLGIISGLEIDPELISTINSMNHLPSLKALLLEDKLKKNDIIKIILSDEATSLRKWISQNLQPGLDVREFYIKSYKQLPSKQNWIKWLKFGGSTFLTTALSFVLSGNPILASILGIGVGAADHAFGDKMTEKLLDPYHPREWIGYFGDNIK
jgi:hypothetical protein